MARHFASPPFVENNISERLGASIVKLHGFTTPGARLSRRSYILSLWIIISEGRRTKAMKKICKGKISYGIGIHPGGMGSQRLYPHILE
jgi:hypothetical protein